jgi:hypothetical protein
MTSIGSESSDRETPPPMPDGGTTPARLPRRKAYVGDTLLVLASMMLTLVAAELLLRAFPRLQVQTAEGEYRYCNATTIRHQTHPAYGYSETPGSSYFERYGPADPWYYIHINAEGFRDNYETNGRPVLLLGDSSSRGSLVNESETFATLMDRWHPEWSFHNYGVGGYGQANAIRVYEEKAPALPHDLVIQQFSLANDIDDNAERAVMDGDTVRITIKPMTIAPIRTLSLPVQIHRFFWEYSKLYPWIYNITIRPYFDNWDARQDIDRSLEITRRLLAKLAADARANQADLLLLVLPAWAEMDGRNDGMLPERQRTMLEAFAAETPNVYLLDATTVLAHEDTDKTFGVVDKHMTPFGHFLVAQALERWMVTDWPRGPKASAPARTFQPSPPAIPDCSQADAYLPLAKPAPSS